MGEVIESFVPRRYAARFVEIYVTQSKQLAEAWADAVFPEEELREAIRPHLAEAFAKYGLIYEEPPPKAS